MLSVALVVLSHNRVVALLTYQELWRLEKKSTFQARRDVPKQMRYLDRAPKITPNTFFKPSRNAFYNK
jgi:hypothetical protein